MKRIPSFALLLALCLLLSGCFSDILENLVGGESSSVVDESSTVSNDDSFTSETDSSLESGITLFQSREISSLTELRDYIRENKDRGVLSFGFKYLGDSSELDGVVIARIATACVVNYYIENENEYTITIIEYPGDRIVDAYRSGDMHLLNDDEKKALKIAEEIVNDAAAKAKNSYELEILLHDEVLKRVSYFDGTTEVPDAFNPPRHLTVVGALIDGKANCQGYADAFYTLASIAGFEVGRMSVYNNDGSHICNTVKLDGNWYVVDTTFNDAFTDSEDAPSLYYLFNAGRDMCCDFVWSEETEYYPIADKSDENYYYFEQKGKSVLCFDDEKKLANEIMKRWYYDGVTEFHAAVLGKKVTWEELADEFQNASIPAEIGYNYTIWTLFNGRDSFFAVRLTGE